MTIPRDLALSVRGLRKSYGARRALDGLDLTRASFAFVSNRRRRFARASFLPHDTESEAGWLTVHLAPDRPEEANRSLAEARIYASELHVGSDLEELFLTLTSASAQTDPDGTFQRITTIAKAAGRTS